MNIEKFGARVKLYRERAGYTQAEFGELIGKSPHHLSQIERGQSLPSLPIFNNICKVLQIPADCFLIDEDRFYMEYSTIKMISLLDPYSDKELEKVVEIAQAIRGALKTGIRVEEDTSDKDNSNNE